MARANSLWPLPLQPLVAVLSSWLPWPPIMIFDLDLNVLVFSASSRYVNMGTISKKWHLSYVRYTSKCQNQDGLLQLALVSSGGIFDLLYSSRNWQSYTGWRLRTRSSRPEQIVDGVMKLQELVRTERKTKKFTWIPGIIGIL
jgi:NADH-quinone oxidoreductase subunit B